MSNHLAVASVTAVLAEYLADAVDAAVTGAKVNHQRPDQGDAATASVNIYAYGVKANTALSNADLPTRRGDGSALARPTLAIDVHYLFTFYGDDGRLEPQRLLGAVATALHARPVLDPDYIRATLPSVVDDAGDPYLQDSNLGFQLERIRVAPLSLDLEAMSKLWSVFFQTAYSLSVAYQASVVLLEADDVVPTSPLPVTRRTITALPFARPRLTRVASLAGPLEPITDAATIVLTGTSLSADNVRVRVGDQLEPPSALTDREARLVLADVTDPLPAGPTIVSIVHLVSLDGGPLRDFGFESESLVFLLRPTVTVPGGADAPTSTRVRVDLSPDLQPGQRVTLLLSAGSDRFAFSRDPVLVATSQVEFAISDVPAATYLLRVSVDGAESPLQLDGDGKPIGPTAVIP